MSEAPDSTHDPAAHDPAPHDSAHVRIILADYAVAGAGGKLTLVGGGIGIISINPITGTTAPFSVVAIVSFDPQQIGESPAIELSLETESGQLVVLPGQPGPLRVAIAERLDAPGLPGAHIPHHAVRPKKQFLLQFQTGLPLIAGTGYRWRIRVDQNTDPQWTETFYVPQASRGIVLN
jgi:hypothetical protein